MYNPTPDNKQSPENSNVLDLNVLDESFQVVTFFNNAHSHYLCPRSLRLYINTPEGLALIQSNNIKKFYENGPFLGKAGVRLSCPLDGSSGLVAVVPDQQVVINVGNNSLWSVNPCTVYIYDLHLNTVLYEKDFNHPIKYLRASHQMIVCGTSQRMVVFRFDKTNKQATKGKTRYANKYDASVIEGLLDNYKKSCDKIENVRYFEVEQRNILSDCEYGRIDSSEQDQNGGIGYVSFLKDPVTICVYYCQIDYMVQYKDPFERGIEVGKICFSKDNKYMAVASKDGTIVRIFDLKTRKVFTEFYRGRERKPILSMGFFGDNCNWFALASEDVSASKATLHLFEVRARKPEEQYILSTYKRYFKIFVSNIELAVRNKNMLIMVSPAEGCLEIIDLERAGTRGAEDAKKTISTDRFQLWNST